MKSTFGKRLAELRKGKNLTQRELALILDKSTSTIAMWETGDRDPDSEMIKSVAKIFNVPTDYLLGASDSTNGNYENGRTGWIFQLNDQSYLEYFYENAHPQLIKAIGRKSTLEDLVDSLNSIFDVLGYETFIYTSDERDSDSLKLHLEITNRILNELADEQDYRILRSAIDVANALNHIGQSSIPIIGTICAGDGLLAEQNIEGTIGYPLLQSKRPDFALRIKGNSMSGIGILDGDIVFMKKAAWAEFNGQIVAAIINGDEGTIKRMKWSEGSPIIQLIPENDEFDLIAAYPNEIQVCGVYMGLFRPEN